MKAVCARAWLRMSLKAAPVLPTHLHAPRGLLQPLDAVVSCQSWKQNFSLLSLARGLRAEHSLLNVSIRACGIIRAGPKETTNESGSTFIPQVTWDEKLVCRGCVCTCVPVCVGRCWGVVLQLGSED